MIRKLERELLALHLVADVALTLLALRLSVILRHHLLIGIERRQGLFVLDQHVYLIVALVWTVGFPAQGVFASKRAVPLRHEYVGLTRAVALCLLVLASLFYMFDLPPSRLLLAYFAILDVGLLMTFHGVVRCTLRVARSRGHNTRNVLIVGSGPTAEGVVASIVAHAWSGLRPVGVLDDAPARSHVHGVPVVGSVAALPAVLKTQRIDEVIIALPAAAHETVVLLSREVQRFPVVVKVAPDIRDVFLLHSTVSDLWGLPLLSVREPAITGLRWAIKRAIDVALASVLLVVLAPLMALTGLAILVDTGRPIFFRQERVGEHGRPFSMLKFRTMYPSPAAAAVVSKYKRPNDPRVTPLGRILRRSSLDEVPQLINVLRGDMSLVGPRPELPGIVAQYEPWQHARHVVRPGMTGWWQINGRSELPLHLHTHLDLFYIQHFSVLLDLRILARTFGAVIRRRGAF